MFLVPAGSLRKQNSDLSLLLPLQPWSSAGPEARGSPEPDLGSGQLQASLPTLPQPLSGSVPSVLYLAVGKTAGLKQDTKADTRGKTGLLMGAVREPVWPQRDRHHIL